MCQAYETEAKSIHQSERQQRRQKMADHQSGKKRMTDDEIYELMAEEMMARDAGY